MEREKEGAGKLRETLAAATSQQLLLQQCRDELQEKMDQVCMHACLTLAEEYGIRILNWLAIILYMYTCTVEPPYCGHHSTGPRRCVLITQVSLFQRLICTQKYIYTYYWDYRNCPESSVL